MTDPWLDGRHMVGIVLVSHSRALAEAALGLAHEMVPPEDRPVVALAAGLGPDSFGTDATAVAEAIAAVDGPDGVLVLLDLGSAVLSAEMALELLEPGVRDRVTISAAPLVEGLVAAFVQASTGAPLATVAAEAERGLAAKQEHLGGDYGGYKRPIAAEGAAEGPAAGGVVVEVRGEHGLHARPAARLVGLAGEHDARITVTNLDTGRGPVDAGSLSMVMTLGAQQGHRLRFDAAGPDAAAALAAVTALADTGFGDQAPTDYGGYKRPIAANGGGEVAIGPAVVPVEVDLGGYRAGDVETERGRSADAVAVVADELTRLRDQAGGEAGIFEAHLALLADPELAGQVERAIGSGAPAPEAWAVALDALANDFAALPDPYQRARAEDVRAVRRGLLTALSGQTRAPEPRRGILVVPEIDPATAATVDADGIATRAGGATGHGVLVARSRGIPVITGIGDVPVQPGTVVAFDARTGRFVVDPDQASRAEFEAIRERRRAERAAALAAAHQPARTKDGQHIPVLANVGSLDDARAAASQGAEGSGLVRTELLFGDRATPPDLDEQVAAYVAIGRALDGPITIRTWDAGADKPLAFLPMPPEPNPFLGERGLRTFRRRPELLRVQLQAIARAAEQTPVRVMFPMVTTAEEVQWARGLVDLPDRLEVGIMVETPAAALRIDILANGIDFVSVGSNDLTQYTVAADRGNAAVAQLADGLEPAVLQLIAGVGRHGIDTAVCGDLASDPDTAVLLVGLGVDELSVVPNQVPLVKARLREIDLATARQLAARALTAPSAAAVREMLTGQPDIS